MTFTYNPRTDVANRTPKIFDKDSEEHKVIQFIEAGEHELASILMISLELNRLDIIKYLLFDCCSPKKIFFKYEDVYNDKVIPIALLKSNGRDGIRISSGDYLMKLDDKHYIIEINNIYSKFADLSISGINFDEMYDKFLNLMSSKVK